MRSLPSVVPIVALALAACTPSADRSGESASTPRPADTASLEPRRDTAVSALWERAKEPEPPGEGPLFPFADSIALGGGQSRTGSWGFRDAGGRVVVPARYAYAAPMFAGLAPIAVRDDWGMLRWGYVNAAGEIVIAPRFDGAGRFESGRALVMVDHRFMVVDSAGAVVERLAERSGSSVPPTLPEPCDSCDLRTYIARLRPLGNAVRLYVQPVEGESYVTMAVQRHAGDVVAIAEGGWEHWSFTLRIPGITIEQGVALARRIWGSDAMLARDDQDSTAVVLQGDADRVEAGFEDMRVRIVNGVVEIMHTGGV